MPDGWNATGHAIQPMARRHIPFEAVSYIVERYDTKRPAPPRRAAKPADILIGTYGSRRFWVYVERGTRPPLVKTAAWEDD